MAVVQRDEEWMEGEVQIEGRIAGRIKVLREEEGCEGEPVNDQSSTAESSRENLN